MGKRTITRRRGRGTVTYRAHSFRFKGGEVKHRPYDTVEKTEGVLKGTIIDFKHCSGHSAPLAKVQFENKEVRYILAAEHMMLETPIESGADASVSVGNTLPLGKIPNGSQIYNVELVPGDGGKLCRVAGTHAIVIGKRGDHVLVEFPSKKKKELNERCRATLGVIASGGRSDKPFVKAGTRHHLMRAKGKLYPRTSGVAMNAVDHPYGSGRGRQHAKIKVSGPFAPPGKKVGKVSAKRTGRKR